MLPCHFTSSKLYAKDDIANLSIAEGKYKPNYEPPHDLISQDKFLNLFQEINQKSKLKIDEHEIVKVIVNRLPIWETPNSLYDYKLFIHWYERRYKTKIVNENILINLNSFNELWSNNKNKISQVYSKEECKILILENILRFSKSEIYNGQSIFYENYFPIFPELESFSFDDFKGVKFIRYLLDLFPTIRGITSKKLHFIRFPFEQPNDWTYEGGIHYFGQHQLPSFVPMALNKGNKTINYRSIENLLRSNKGLPKIGEGWISETTLFYQVKERLSEYQIIQHGRPEFLGRQHLDIWIPELKIGIEYHGSQHDRPIDFFGGEISFLENQKRDERKRNLCLENGVRLIEVREGYDIDSIIQMIFDIQGIN
jgi:hypothetical protein